MCQIKFTKSSTSSNARFKFYIYYNNFLLEPHMNKIMNNKNAVVYPLGIFFQLYASLIFINKKKIN